MASIPAPPTRAPPQGGARRPSGLARRLSSVHTVEQVRRTNAQQEDELAENERRAQERQVKETRSKDKKASMLRSMTKALRQLGEMEGVDEDDEDQDDLENEKTYAGEVEQGNHDQERHNFGATELKENAHQRKRFSDPVILPHLPSESSGNETSLETVPMTSGFSAPEVPSQESQEAWDAFPNVSYPPQDVPATQEVTAAEEVSAAKTALDLISFGTDGRKAAPALKLVRNALISYHGAANTRLKAASLQSQRRARGRPSPTPLLSQAMPIPSKRGSWGSRSTSVGSSLPARGATSSSMGGGAPATPAPETGRPNTTAGVNGRRPHLQAVTLPRRPETSAQVGGSDAGRMSPPTTEVARPNTSGGFNRRLYSRTLNLPARRQAPEQVDEGSGGRMSPVETSHSASSQDSSRACSPGSDSSPRSKTRSSTILQKIPQKLKPIHRLYTLGGRLSRKAFTIKTSRLVACDLAMSCRKRSRAVERMMRREEHSIAAVQANTRTFAKDQPVNRDTGGIKGFRRIKTQNSDVPNSSPTSTGEDKPDATSATSAGAQPTHAAELTVFDAFDLAQDLNLPPGQVTHAWKLFKRYDADNDGLLAPYDFQLLLRAVLRERFPSAREVPRDLFREALEIQSTSMAVTFNDFLTWITQNSFTEDLLLSDNERFVRRIARRFAVPLLEVEKVKGHFDSFDADGSGQIEEPEFNQLLGKLLNLPDADALPESRVKSFWRELDDDCSGVVEFHEFIPWYLGYFGGYSGTSPLVNFYRRVRPVPFHDD